MSSTNLKNHPKTQNQPKIKKSYGAQICFSRKFQGKNTYCELPLSNRTI